MECAQARAGGKSMATSISNIVIIIFAESKECCDERQSLIDSKVSLCSGNANIANNTLKSSRKNGVVFNECVQVVLIPSRCEYERLALGSSLWWSSLELQQFRIQAYQNIKHIACKESITLKDDRK
jgi:hypothetical protein